MKLSLNFLQAIREKDLFKQKPAKVKKFGTFGGVFTPLMC